MTEDIDVFLSFPGSVRAEIVPIHAGLATFGVRAYFDRESTSDDFAAHIANAMARARSFAIFLPRDVVDLGRYFRDEINRILVRADKEGVPVLVLAENPAGAAGAPLLYGLTSQQFKPWAIADASRTTAFVENWLRTKLGSCGRCYTRTLGLCKVALISGDLFRQGTDLAVLSSDYFDTDTATTIAPTSMKAILTKDWFAGDRAPLDRTIEANLLVRGVSGEQVADPRKLGKTVRYPIGTVAIVKHPAEDGRRAYLVVGATMDFDTVTVATPETLWSSLCALWRAVFRYGPTEIVSVPIWGSGLGRAGLPQTHLGAMLLLSFAVMTKQLGRPPCRELRVVVWEPEYRPDVFASLAAALEGISP